MSMFESCKSEAHRKEGSMKGFTTRWLVLFVGVGLVFVGSGCATRQKANVAAVPEQEAIPSEPQEERYNDVQLPPEVNAIEESEAKTAGVKESEGIPYTVRTGDNLWRIARRHAVSIAEIKECNTLSNPDKLRIGQVITLPPNAHEVPVSELPRKKAPAVVEPYTGETIEYVIKNGDTLGGIAKAHGTTAALLRGANGLAGDRIIAGRKLKVPAPKQAPLAVEPAVTAPMTTLEPAPSTMTTPEATPSTTIPATPPAVETAPPTGGLAPAPAEPIIQ
jgi:LysM repeat protein